MKPLYNIFKLFFKNHIQEEFNIQHHDLLKSNKEQKEKDKQLFLKSKYPENETFICVGNEWTRLSLVKVVGFDRNIPLIKDLSTNEIKICFAILIPFDKDLLILLKLLNPYQRYSLLNYHNPILDKKILTKQDDPKHFDNEPALKKFLKSICFFILIVIIYFLN